MNTMSMTNETQPTPADHKVRSVPTLCISCHLIVQLEHVVATEATHDKWVCPQCQHTYPAKHWPIRRARNIA